MEEKLYRCLKRLTVNHYFTDHLDIICEAHRLVREYESTRPLENLIKESDIKGVYEEFGPEHTKHNEEHK